jgi:uncharacterized membrane protein
MTSSEPRGTRSAEGAAFPGVTRAPAWLRTRVARYPIPALVLGGVFVCLSLTPSLLPRSALLQGFVSGLTAAMGYGIGVGLLAVWRYLELPEPSAKAGRTITIVAATGLAGALVWFLVRSVDWENNLRATFGMERDVSAVYPIVAMLIAVIVWWSLIAISRLVLRSVRWFMRRLEALLPRRLGRVLGATLGVLAIVFLVNGVLLDAAVSGLNQTFKVENATTDGDVTHTTSSFRSGGPGSLVSWDSLGRQGRKWIAKGPTAEEIDGFSGGGALEPIRVYVGLGSAGTAEERAQLVLDELIRTGAFERQILVLATSTGSGGIDPNGTASLEYMFNGDTAIASTQYSYLPSWLSYFVDQEAAREAATVTFNTIHDYWRILPVDSRPRFYLFGVSLGSFGSEASAMSIRVVDAPISGAVWAGPTFMNEQWVTLTADRDAGSPAWLPVFDDGVVVRFTGREDALDVPTGVWRSSRYVYIQHPSDPVSFFSFDLLLHQAAWLKDGERAPDISPDMNWYPFVTFWQVALDLPMAGSVPPGYGHNFGSAAFVDTWAAITQPAGWTEADAVALKQILPAGAE